MLIIDDVQIVINSPHERMLREEILNKALFLLTCIKGTIPMNRELGLDPNIISSPAYIAQNLYTISAIELIDEFEPRVSVEEVSFVTYGNTENMIPKVVLTYNAE